MTAPNAYEAVTNPNAKPNFSFSVTEETIYKESPYPKPLEKPKKIPYPIIQPIQLSEFEINSPMIGRIAMKNMST